MMDTENSTRGTTKNLLATDQAWVLTEPPIQLPTANLTQTYLISAKDTYGHPANFQAASIVVVTIDRPATLDKGVQLIKDIRNLPSMQPVLAILNYRVLQAKVECYWAGADHCITANNNPEQLQSLINSLILSEEWQPTLRLTLDEHCLHLCNGAQKLELTYQEVQVLHALVNTQGNILHHHSMAELMDLNIRIYGPHILEKAVSRLRNKVKKNFGVNIIHSVRGYGYRLLRGVVSLKQINKH